MALTPDQVNQFSVRAKQAGYSDEEIQAEIARKSQEMQAPAPTQSPAPQITQSAPSFSEKIGQGVLNVGKSMINPFVRTGQTILGAGEEVVRAARSAAGDESAYINPETGEAKGNTFLSNDKLATARTPLAKGSIARQQTADLGNIASYAVPFGKGAGGLGKFAKEVLLPGAGVGALQSVGKMGDKDVSGAEVVGDVALGAAGAGAMNIAGKAVGGVRKALSKGGSKAAKTLVESNFVLPGGSGRTSTLVDRLRPEDTVDEIMKHNVPPTLEGMEQFAQKVTGESGVISRGTREAVARASKEIDVGDVLTPTRNLVSKSGLPKKRAEEIMEAISFSVAERPGKTPGRISATDALDIMRDLESEGMSWIVGDTPLSPHPEWKKIGQAYMAAADALSGEINKSVPDVALQGVKASLLEEAKGISPRLAQQIIGAKSLADLRSIAAPFVRLDHMVSLTKNYQRGALMQTGNQATSRAVGAATGFGVGGPVGAAVGAIAAPVVDSTIRSATVPTRNVLAKGVQAATSGLGKIPSLTPTASGQIGARIGTSMGTGGEPTSSGVQFPEHLPSANLSTNVESGQQEQNQENNVHMDGSIPQTMGLGQAPALTEQAKVANPWGLNLQELSQLYSLAVMSGDTKAASQIGQVLQVEQEFQKSGESKALSVSAQENRMLGESGIRAVDEIENIISKNPSKIWLGAIPGKLGSRDYDAAAFRAVEALLRLRTGAAAPEEEVRRYMKAYLPQPGDGAETMNSKLQALRNDLDAAAQFGGVDAESLLLEQQGLGSVPPAL